MPFPSLHQMGRVMEIFRRCSIPFRRKLHKGRDLSLPSSVFSPLSSSEETDLGNRISDNINDNVDDF